MTPKEREQERRAQLTAAGLCHECRQPSSGYYCLGCASERSTMIAGYMRTLRAARAFIGVMELLAENKCVDCQHPKEFFHAWRCKRCRRQSSTHAA